jgi:lipoprotein-releasing system ATP-binding protein
MIQASNITKSYGKLAVLNGVNFTAQTGEIVSIMGASGAGKTTFLQILGTLESADSGKIVFEGTEITKLKAKALAQFRNQNLGFVFQFHHLLPEFTALENVAIPGFIAKKKKNDCLKEAARLLDFMGLSNRIDHKPTELSGGEQQRVAVARALINQPKLVLADEPTGNLDSTNAEEIHRLFAQIRDEFKTSFIIITHNKELATTADRQLKMKDGVILNPAS